MAFAGVYPPAGGTGGGVPVYTNLAAFPSAATAGNGALAIALDTDTLYISNGTSWQALGSPSTVLSVGTIDSEGSPSANGATITGNALIMQSASATAPGLANTATQTFAGAKTFSTAPILSSLTASTALALDASNDIVSSSTTAAELAFVHGVTSAIQTQLNSKQATLTIGNLTDAGTDGITVGSGTGAVIGGGTTISQHVADTTHNGYLSSTDWNTFNGKGTGSVTSVAMTVPTFLSVGGSPVTGSGTLGVTLSGTALPLVNGGTGQTTKAPAFDALQPMTTAGDIIYGGTAGTGTRLAAGTTSQVLVGGTTPSWGNVPAAAIPAATTGAVGGITLKAPTIQRFISGTGATYTTPAGVLWIRVRMVGGGAGGQGSGGSGQGGGTAGNASSFVFSANTITANGGSAAGGANGVSGGLGGTATALPTGSSGLTLAGGNGGGAGRASISGSSVPGGMGGSSAFGGASGGGAVSDTTTPAASANTGSGGGGGVATAGAATNTAGAGGGSGAFVDAIIPSPPATCTYTVGATAAGGAAGTVPTGASGGTGAAGIILVEEHYY